MTLYNSRVKGSQLTSAWLHTHDNTPKDTCCLELKDHNYQNGRGDDPSPKKAVLPLIVDYLQRPRNLRPPFLIKNTMNS